MGQLYLVRHGRASFGSDDYDRLSDLPAAGKCLRWASSSANPASSSRPR